MKVVTVVGFTALLLCCHAANVHGNIQGTRKAKTASTNLTLVNASEISTCPMGDQCCQYSASAADCTSTESVSKGCRSRVKCAAKVDPCSAATSRSSCLTANNLCRFNSATGACTLDAALHSCASISDLDECAASSDCQVSHECKDSCAPCLKCLEAAKTFAQLPAILRTMSATGGDSSQFFKGFCLSTVMSIDPSMQSQILAGCDRIVFDTPKSSALLQRPGALCSRLGMCQASCTAAAVAAPTSDATGTNITTATTPKVSMCSSTGSTADDAMDAASPTAAAVPSVSNWADNSGLPASPQTSNALPSSAMSNVVDSSTHDDTYCVTSADCKGDLACDTFSQPRCHTSCDPATGMDRCIAAGNCVDFCERPDIKLAIEDSKRRLQTCSNTTGCSQGQHCGVPDFPCKIVTCSNAAAATNGGNPLQVKDCPAICLHERPQLVSAKFSDDGRSITVLLNQEAAPVEALCAYIFDEATSSLLGAFSRCTTGGNTLTILLAGVVSIRPGQHGLTISKRNGLLASVFGVNSDTGAPVFSGGLAVVESCGNCSQSAVPVKITGPSQIALPCDSTTQKADSYSNFNAILNGVLPQLNPAGFSFAAVTPSDSMWMIKDIHWALVQPHDITVLKQPLDAANHKPNIWDRRGISLPVSALPGLPEGPITISVNVTNIFNITSTTNFTFNKHNSSQAPAFELDKTLTQFYPSQGFRVVAKRLPSTCKMNGVGSEVIEWSTDIPGVDLKGIEVNRLVFTPNELLGNVEVGKVYNISFKAYYPGTDSVTTDTLSLKAAGSPLAVRLAGPSGTIPMLKGNITYDAAGSRDPDDPEDTTAHMTYLWSCYNNIDMAPCFGAQAGAAWTMDPSKLIANQSYTVTLTAAKGSRNSTATTTITPMTTPVPSGQITRFCGLQLGASSTPKLIASISDKDMAVSAGLEAPDSDMVPPSIPGVLQPITSDPMAKPCAAKHNPSDPLTLVVTPDPAYSNANLTWWIDPASAPGVNLSQENTAAGIHGNTMTILPAGLPAGGAVTVHVNMSVPGKDDVVGTSSISIPLNSPPYCSTTPLSDCAVLNTTVGTFPTARFKLRANGWADPDQDALTYEFGLVTDEYGRQPMASGSSNAYTFSSLLPGNNTLYVCAIDSFGARACQRADVSVTRPKLAWDARNVEDNILNIAGTPGHPTQDIVPTNAVDAALQMASLLAYSVTDAVNSVGDFLGLLHDGSAPATSATVPALAYKPEVQNVTNKVLVALAKAGRESNDPEELDALLTAGAKLGTATKTNAQGGRALVNLYRHTMQANNKQQKALTAQQSNTYTDAFTVGLAANTPPKAVKPAHPKSSPPTQMTYPTSSAAAKPGVSGLPNSNSTVLPRQLLATPQNLTSVNAQNAASTFTSIQAYKCLLDGVKRLTQAQDVILGAPAVAVGNAGMCVAPALLQQKAVGGAVIRLECPGVTAGAEVVLPEPFAAACRKDPACSSSSSLLINSQYYSPEGSMAAIIMAVIDKSSHMIKRDRNINTIVVSGLLNITMNYTTPTRSFCPAAGALERAATRANTAAGNITTNINTLSSASNTTTISDVTSPVGDVTRTTSSGPCKAKLRFPIDAKLFDASKTLECVNLVPEGYGNKGLEAAASYPVTNITQTAVVLPPPAAAAKMPYRRLPISGPVTASVPGLPAAAAAAATPIGSTTAVYAECLVPKQGLYVVVQWPATSDPAIADLTPDLVPGAFATEPVQGTDQSDHDLNHGDLSQHSADRDGTDSDQGPRYQGSATDQTLDSDQSSIRYSYTFNLDYLTLAANDETLDNFKSQIQRSFLTGVSGVWTDGPSLADTSGALQLSYVTVSNVRPAAAADNAVSGSYTIVDIILIPPKDTTHAQMDQLNNVAPAEFISTSSRLQALLLTAEVVSSHYNPKHYKAPLRPAVIAGVVVGCVVSAAVGVALAVWAARKHFLGRHSTSKSIPGPGVDDLPSIGATSDNGNNTSSPGFSEASGEGIGAAGSFSQQNVRDNPLHDHGKLVMPDHVVHQNYMFYCADELITGGADALSTEPHESSSRGTMDAFNGAAGDNTAPVSPRLALVTRSTAASHSGAVTQSTAADVSVADEDGDCDQEHHHVLRSPAVL